ncbi:hypothetical protein BDZ45DRAFT_746429 [Acephala macrosclerotiorum]|nr:hypothetical protein BDZ45DRAFT_746429 [Acephala macrosclerotiorum]
MLSPEFLDNIATPAFETTIRRSIELWKLKAQVSEDGLFAAYDDLRRTTLEGIWKVLLGRDLGLADASISLLQQKKGVNTAAVPSKAFPYFFQDLILLVTGLLWVVTGISPRFYKWIVNIIARFRSAVKTTKELFEGLIYETRMHIATETLITWCGLIERLCDALKRVFPTATRSQLPSGLDVSRAEIPYLEVVLAEILRLTCTGPVLLRETLTDCEIMGHRVPANTPVFLITQSPPGYMITSDTFDVEKELGAKHHEETTKDRSWSSSCEDFIPE